MRSPKVAIALAAVFPDRTDVLDLGAATDRTRYKNPEPLATSFPEVPPNLPNGSYRVVVAFIVEADGTVQRAVPDVASRLDSVNAACTAAVLRYYFHPALMDDKPAAVLVTQEFRFRVQ